MAEKYVERIKSASSGEIYTIRDPNVATKQDTLVSGENIKTVNNQSLLGSGNITIQGGGGAVDSVNGKTGTVVLNATDVGAASPTTVHEIPGSGDNYQVTLQDNVVFTSDTEIPNLTITPAVNPTADFGCIVQFTSGQVATAVVSPNVIYRGDSTANGIFTPIANKRYSVYFMYNGVNTCGSVQGV